MGIVSPIPTYIINIFFFTFLHKIKTREYYPLYRLILSMKFFAHFKLNKNHGDTIPYTDLYYQ